MLACKIYNDLWHEQQQNLQCQDKCALTQTCNVYLIKRFQVILECLNCGFAVDTKNEMYASETGELDLKKYSHGMQCM